jgi:hypothetical protein
MLNAVVLIAFGAVAIFWGAWLLPRRLSNVRTRIPRDGHRRFDHLLGRRDVRWLFATPVVCGGLLIVTGAVFWLTQ